MPIVQRGALQAVRQDSNRAPARFQGTVHRRAVDASRPSGNDRPPRLGGQTSEAPCTRQRALPGVPGSHDGQAARAEQCRRAAPPQERRGLLPEPALQARRVRRVGPAGHPDRALAPAVEREFQGAPPPEQRPDPLPVDVDRQFAGERRPRREPAGRRVRFRPSATAGRPGCTPPPRADAQRLARRPGPAGPPAAGSRARCQRSGLASAPPAH